MSGFRATRTPRWSCRLLTPALATGRVVRAAFWHWFERTGLAREQDGSLVPVGDAPIAESSDSDGSLRYACGVALPNGRIRFYFEAARPDGSHDLMTCM
jgi:hypothetical protein